MSNRKFFRNVFTLVILSEDEPVTDLYDATYGMIHGGYSGVCDVKSTSVSAKRMAEMLEDQGSDPEFFRLTPEGKDMNEDDDFVLDPSLKAFFKVEIRNEQHGGVSPATLESAIDSWNQAPDDVLARWCGIDEDPLIVNAPDRLAKLRAVVERLTQLLTSIPYPLATELTTILKECE